MRAISRLESEMMRPPAHQRYRAREPSARRQQARAVSRESLVRAQSAILRLLLRLLRLLRVAME